MLSESDLVERDGCGDMNCHGEESGIDPLPRGDKRAKDLHVLPDMAECERSSRKHHFRKERSLCVDAMEGLKGAWLTSLAGYQERRA